MKRRVILQRTVIYFLIMVFLVLGLYSAFLFPWLKKNLLDDLQDQARTMSVSISQVTASSLLLEDFSSVIDHCINVIKERPTILFVVVTRKDGFSLLHTKQGWRNIELDDNWALPENTKDWGEFEWSPMVKENVYHFRHKFTYGGVYWGWIHIGLSTRKYRHDLDLATYQTIVSIIFCLGLGIGLSVLFASQLTKPILALHEITEKIADGDLSIRAEVKSKDELQDLADSFNMMIQRLQDTQQKLIQARNFNENIIRSMLDALIVLGKNESIVVSNNAATELLDYSDQEFGKLKIEEIFTSKDECDSLKTPVENIRDFIKEGSFQNRNFNLRRKDGSIIPVSVSGSRIIGNQNEQEGIVLVIRDMRQINSLIQNLQIARDEATRSYEELQNAQAQLVQSAKMSAVGQLAAGIAHEINNPLTGVLGNASLVKEIMEESEPRPRNFNKMQSMLDLMIESAIRCKNIVSDLLTFSRQSDFEMKTLEVNEMVEKTLGLLKNQLYIDRIQVSLALSSEKPKVKGILNRLQQVIINIILNADRFMKSGGELSISTVTASDGSNVDIIIKDNGPGIPGENLDRIFDPFFTTASVGQGSGFGIGLGLTISYRIIKEHGGALWAESEVGRGATFFIRLPICKEENQ